MLISTSQDVLYLTIAVCTALFTGFLVWIMYYLAQLTRQSTEMVTDFRQKIEDLDTSIKALKEKVSDSVETFSVVGDKVATILDIVKNVGGSRRRKR